MLDKKWGEQAEERIREALEKAKSQIRCQLCGLPGGTLVKTNSGGYIHEIHHKAMILPPEHWLSQPGSKVKRSERRQRAGFRRGRLTPGSS